MKSVYIKLFLRLAIAISFLSAVADRFGIWGQKVATWGNWQNFVDYTHILLPFLPKGMVTVVSAVATILEIIFALLLLIGFKTELVAKLSGILLLVFALAMTFSTGIKGAFDYSVFTASAAAFGLSLITGKYLEIDSYLKK